jgi:hypothetical protein
MQLLATHNALTPRQFGTFRDFMFARIHLTMPSIAEHAKQALLDGDYVMFATALRNLQEEGSNGDVSRMHPFLAQKAFNAVAQGVFNLPHLTMRAAHEKMVQSSLPMRSYTSTVNELYRTYPAFVSLAQEKASGGDGTTGMMADLYRLFSSFRLQLGTDSFSRDVLPYFAEHLALDENGSFREDTASGIEYQHGIRAMQDAETKIKNVSDADIAVNCILAFANVQKLLFDAMFEEIRRKGLSFDETSDKPESGRLS